MLKKGIRKIFHLREDQSIGFYLTNFFFKTFLRQNRDVPWAVHHTSIIYFPERIRKGAGVYPGDSPGNFIDARNGIEIGDYTNLGPSVGILSANHDMIDNEQFSINPPIKIGAFCWIGMGAKILPATELGDFTIVGAGSVVTSSFAEGYCVVGGNPARIIKQLDKERCEQFRKNKIIR
jgi:acetyltransferase-like isoleucine patch superfamily enzyme